MTKKRKYITKKLLVCFLIVFIAVSTLAFAATSSQQTPAITKSSVKVVKPRPPVWLSLGKPMANFNVGFGDEDDILLASLSPHGSILHVVRGMTGSLKGYVEVSLFNVRKKTRIARSKIFLGDNHVSEMAFTPDERTIALSVADRVTVWDVHTGARRLTLKGIPGGCNIAFSPDGKLLATLGRKMCTIDLWDWRTGVLKAELCDGTLYDEVDRHARSGSPASLFGLDGGDGETSCIRFSPDGKLLAFDIGCFVDIWNLKSRTLFRTMKYYDFWFISNKILLAQVYSSYKLVLFQDNGILDPVFPQMYETAKTLDIDTPWGTLEELSIPQKNVIVALGTYSLGKNRDAEISVLVVSDVKSLAAKKVLPLPKDGCCSLSYDGKYVLNMTKGHVRVWRVPL